MLTFLYVIYRAEEDESTWDDYRKAVVVARSEEEARLIHPDDDITLGTAWWESDEGGRSIGLRNWVQPSRVQVLEIGVAHPDFKSGTVVCADMLRG